MTPGRRTRRTPNAPKPVVLPEPPDIQAAKKLPMHTPGKVLKLSLTVLPAYMALYGLTVNEALSHRQPRVTPAGDSPLLVKRTPKPKTEAQ